MEERINNLESLAAMQEKTLDLLHQELFRQQQDIARLRRYVEALEKKLASLGGPDTISGNEPPPHY